MQTAVTTRPMAGRSRRENPDNEFEARIYAAGWVSLYQLWRELTADHHKRQALQGVVDGESRSYSNVRNLVVNWPKTPPESSAVLREIIAKLEGREAAQKSQKKRK
jgi:hypothetical protein